MLCRYSGSKMLQVLSLHGWLQQTNAPTCYFCVEFLDVSDNLCMFRMLTLVSLNLEAKQLRMSLPKLNWNREAIPAEIPPLKRNIIFPKKKKGEAADLLRRKWLKNAKFIPLCVPKKNPSLPLASNQRLQNLQLTRFLSPASRAASSWDFHQRGDSIHVFSFVFFPEKKLLLSISEW